MTGRCILITLVLAAHPAAAHSEAARSLCRSLRSLGFSCPEPGYVEVPRLSSERKDFIRFLARLTPLLVLETETGIHYKVRERDGAIVIEDKYYYRSKPTQVCVQRDPHGSIFDKICGPGDPELTRVIFYQDRGTKF